MHSVKVLSALAIGFAAFGISQSAHAEQYSLHLDPGLVQPLTAPQDDIYNTGVGLGAKFLFRVCPWAAVGPSTSAFYLPRAVDNGQNAGVYWQFGGSLRLQHEFDEFKNGGGNAIRPWIDLDVSAGHTGVVWNPVIDTGIGMETALDSAHVAWLGPFLRYQHAFQTAPTQDGVELDRRPINMLWAGAELSIDFPPRHRHDVVIIKETRTYTVHDPVYIHIKEVVQVPVPNSFDIGKVYFNWDSPKLRSWEETDKIDQLVSVLNAHPEAKVRVQGNASVDGQRAHNITLAGNRTASVVAYLVAHGVDASRIISENNGVDSPSHDNGTQEGRERNRRVEFVVNYTAVGQK